MRLDVYLVSKGIFSSRELAKFNIAKGNVLVNGALARKPSLSVEESDSITLSAENAVPYVSRGGLKLEKAIKEFNFHCDGIDAMDVGASTGGFTDCLLQHGAKLVCAIDVGSNQLVEPLRTDARVFFKENINIKDLDPRDLKVDKFDLIVADLSFISLTKVLQYFPKFLKPNGSAILLIKPQFEVGSQLVGKGGIVKDPSAHIMAITNVGLEANKYGLYIKNITSGPIHQSGKNIEYLALFERVEDSPPNFAKVVKYAFNEMKQL